jgi:hypothetical protein
MSNLLVSLLVLVAVSVALTSSSSLSVAQQDAKYLTTLNQDRASLSLAPIKYDSGLIKMAAQISFDMASQDKLFRPLIESKQMSMTGCAFKISKDSTTAGLSVRRQCFGNMFRTERENDDCRLFDGQEKERHVEWFGFGRRVANNRSSNSVYIVKIFGNLNRFKPVEVEVQAEVAEPDNQDEGQEEEGDQEEEPLETSLLRLKDEVKMLKSEVHMLERRRREHHNRAIIDEEDTKRVIRRGDRRGAQRASYRHRQRHIVRDESF